MAGETLSPNMSLVLPGVGVTAGPQYASDLNSSLSIIDSHTHSSGSGVQITPDGMNISSDLNIGSNNLTLVRSVRLAAQGSPLALASDLGCLYESGVDLYYNDGSGNQVRITQSGGVAGTPGSIGSLVSPASVNYDSGSSTFVFQSAANTAGNIDCQDLVLRNATASSKGLTLYPPAAMAADIAITLPALPASGTKFVRMSSAGAQTAAVEVDGSSINISSNTLQVPAGGIIQSKLYSRTVDLSAAAGNVGSTTSSGTISITSTGETATGLDTALICTGRPVVGMFLTTTTTGNGSFVRCDATSGANIIIKRDGSIIASWYVGNTFPNPYFMPFSFLDVPGAGSHTYQVYAKLLSGSATLIISDMTLVVYEI